MSYQNVSVSQSTVSVRRVNLGRNDWVHLWNITCWLGKLLHHWAITNVMGEDGTCVLHVTFCPMCAPELLLERLHLPLWSHLEHLMPLQT